MGGSMVSGCLATAHAMVPQPAIIRAASEAESGGSCAAACMQGNAFDAGRCRLSSASVRLMKNNEVGRWRESCSRGGKEGSPLMRWCRANSFVQLRSSSPAQGLGLADVGAWSFPRAVRTGQSVSRRRRRPGRPVVTASTIALQCWR